MTGVQHTLEQSSLGRITHRNLEREYPMSNADGGLFGGIANAIGNVVTGVTSAVGQGISAKQDRKAREAEAAASVKIEKDKRTEALSNTTQELIKANEEKQRNKQRTNMIIIVFTVLAVATLAYLTIKDDKP